MVWERGLSKQWRIREAFIGGGISGRGTDGVESGVGSINRDGKVRNFRVRCV
jgi:hypothetical protein